MITEEKMSIAGMGYKFIRQLGFGAYGLVRLYEDPKGQQKAIKIISDDLIDQCKRQIDICSVLMKLKHENIVAIENTFKAEEGTCIVMEYCQEGSLQKMKGKLSPSEAYGLVKALLQGLDFMHSKDIIHRDIKPANILLKRKDGRLIPKLCDFGASKFQNKGMLSYSIIGTDNYMAPQVTNWDGYSFSSDIWSLGVVLYQLFFNYNPFKSSPQKLQVADHLQLPRIFKNMLRGKSDRKSAKQLLQSVFQIHLSDSQIKHIEQKRKQKQSQQSCQSNKSDNFEDLALITEEATQQLSTYNLKMSRPTTSNNFQRKQIRKPAQTKPQSEKDLQLAIERLNYQNLNLRKQNTDLSNQLQATKKKYNEINKEVNFIKKQLEDFQKKYETMSSENIELNRKLNNSNNYQKIIIDRIRVEKQLCGLLQQECMKNRKLVHLQHEVSEFLKKFNKLYECKTSDLGGVMDRLEKLPKDLKHVKIVKVSVEAQTQEKPRDIKEPPGQEKTVKRQPSQTIKEQSFQQPHSNVFSSNSSEYKVK